MENQNKYKANESEAIKMIQQDKCTSCDVVIEDGEPIYSDNEDNFYCEHCWIELEARFKGLMP